MNKGLYKSIATTTLAVALCSGVSNIALAQDTDENSWEAGSSSIRQLDEIVITAQKRAEKTQDIPIAVSALNDDALDRSGFDGVGDLSFMVPSLQFGNFGPVSFLNIRGIGSADPSAGSDPGVALHIDGVYIGRPVGALFTSFDTERVEVLRGPQGTLYGRNATGGSVNLITKKPDDEFGGEIEVTLGNYGLVRTRGSLNAPISDSIRTRVVGFREVRDGFTENTYPGGTEANDLDNWGIRGHVDIDLSDNVGLLLSATYVNIGGVGSQPEQRDEFSILELNPPINSLVGGPFPQLAPGIPANLAFYTNVDGSIPVNDTRPFIEGKDFAEYTDNSLTLLSATLDWDIGSVTLKSVTGYAESKFDTAFDSDMTTAPNAIHRLLEEAQQFSQELQLISNHDGPFRWIVGAYYFKEELTRFSTQDGLRFDTIRDLFIANNFSFSGPGFNEEVSFRVGGDVETESFAFFGQGSYNVTDKLTLTAGLRYTDDDKNALNQNIQLASLVLTHASTASQEVTGKVAIDYRLTDDAMLYGSFSRGYKSGGIIQTSLVSDSAAFKPEFVNTIEIGLKSQLWDVLQLNIAAYSSDYSDLQTNAFGAAGPLGGNAGAASIKGVEVEWTWLMSDIFTFDGSAAYTSATYDELSALDPLDQFGSGGVVDYSGNDLPRVPEFSSNLGLTGYWGLDDGKGNITARLEASYTGSMFYEFTNRPETKTDEYYNINFRLKWTSDNEKTFVELYGTNLTDEVQEGNILLGFGLNVGTLANGYLEPGQEYTTYNPPRQFGIRFGYKY